MKTLVSIKKVVVLFALVLTTAIVSAENQNGDYKWIDNVENGKLMSREILRIKKDGQYASVQKYEYSYNAENQISEKTIYAWNPKNKQWRKLSVTQISYGDLQVEMEVSKWIKSDKLAPSIEKMVYIKNQNDEMILSYIFEKRGNEWIMKDDKMLTAHKK